MIVVRVIVKRDVCFSHDPNVITAFVSRSVVEIAQETSTNSVLDLPEYKLEEMLQEKMTNGVSKDLVLDAEYSDDGVLVVVSSLRPTKQPTVH